jgi:hypothetical protein
MSFGTLYSFSVSARGGSICIRCLFAMQPSDVNTFSGFCIGCSKVPSWLSAFVPTKYMHIEEEAWKAYPKCKTGSILFLCCMPHMSSENKHWIVKIAISISLSDIHGY